MKSKQRQCLKIDFSFDTLLLIIKYIHKKQPNDSLKLCQFLFELFEYTKISYKSYSCFALLLAEIVQIYCSNNTVFILLEHLKELKFYNSYSLAFSLCAQAFPQSKQNDSIYLVQKLITIFINFFNEFTLFTEKLKGINQNMLLTKLSQYVKTKAGFQICEMLGYFLNSNKPCPLTHAQTESICKCLLNFYQTEFFTNLITLFNQSAFASNYASNQVNEHFKSMFKFVTDAVSVWSQVCSSSNDSNKVSLLDFLKKFSPRMHDTNDDAALNRIDLNFKIRRRFIVDSTKIVFSA